MKNKLFFIMLIASDTILYSALSSNPLSQSPRSPGPNNAPPAPYPSPVTTPIASPSNSPNPGNLSPRPSQSLKFFNVKILDIKPKWLSQDIRQTLLQPIIFHTDNPPLPMTDKALTTPTVEKICLITFATHRFSTGVTKSTPVVLIYKKEDLTGEPSYKNFNSEQEAIAWTIAYLTREKSDCCGCC